jgi:tetratricopeptide (TPR) repeat protein
MTISLTHLIGHCICSGLLAALLVVWKINRRWVILFSLLFFISEPAVFLVWGPFRFYGLYALAFMGCLLLAKGTDRFYVFLKTQESIIRILFWAAVSALCAAVILTSVSEIGLRRDAMTFWVYEARIHPSAQVLNDLADVYYAAKKLSLAHENYQKAVNINPKSITAYQGMARIAQENGSWEDVVDNDRKIINLNPQLPQSYLSLADAYRALGDSRQAVETYSRLLSIFPDDEKIDIKVIEAYGRAIADNPQDDLYKEKREEVLADFEQLSKRKNYNAADYYNLGFLYEQVGGKEEAMRFYTKAVQMKPDYAQALFNLASLNQDAGNYKIALELYGRLVHFHPKNALGYLRMGLIFNALGDQQKARQFYLKVVEVDPDNGDAYFNLGYLSEAQGDLSEAVNYYEKAVEVAPKNAEAYYNLGNVYASLGQTGEAIASYLKTVGINPHHQDAFVNLSILSFKSRNFQAAIHYLEQAQALGYNPPAEYLKTLEPYRK